MASCKLSSIFLLLVAVVRMSCCNAESALQLVDFTVTKAEPPHYKVGKPTTVTFSVNLKNTGPTNLTHTSGTVCVLFFDLSTSANISRNVGQVNVSLPTVLSAGQTYYLERRTVNITLTQDACSERGQSKRRTLCAGIKSGWATELLNCLNFTDIDEGGVGTIDCVEPASIPIYAIVLLVVLSSLLIAAVVLLLVYCRKCRSKRTTESQPSSRMSYLRQRFRSLPHIYDNPSVLNLTSESNYEPTIPKNAGLSNAAYRVEDESDSPYSTSLSLTTSGVKTKPRLEDLLRKRPSQANEYTLEDSPNPVPKPRKISMTGNNSVINCEVAPTIGEETIGYCDDPYLPPIPKVTRSSNSSKGIEHQAVSPKPPVAKPRPPSIHNDQDTTTPPRPPRPVPRKGSQTETIDVKNTSNSRPKLMQKPQLTLPRSETERRTHHSSKPIKLTEKSNSDVNPVALKNAIARAVREQSRTMPTSVKDPITLLAENRETNAKIPDPTDPDFLDAVMQNYLSLVFEMSRGEEEYESTMKRELERLDSNTLSVEPQVEYRRKSLSAQLTLSLARKENRNSEIYVNQWNKSWEFKRSNLEVDFTKPLGEGQFGKVYKGEATSVRGHECSMDVAVKVLKDGAGNDAKDEFLKELAIHTILKPNPHVVQLIGCCIRDDPICILTEYLSGGNLLRYLRERPSHLTGKASVQHYIAKFGLHIARGMDYVSKMKIVHRDLAARNILISEYEICKVADFGFARDIFGMAYYPKAPDRAPIRWYAPEAILDDMFSTKSDVWSFGILLFEIATLGKVAPYHGMDNNQVRFSISSASHPKRPFNCDDTLFQIMKICWDKDPEQRPTFHELVVIFEGIQGKYPEPDQTDPRSVDSGFQQNVKSDPHPEISPNHHTVEVNPDLPSRFSNNPIPEIKFEPDSEVDPDPHPEVNGNPHSFEVKPDFPPTANTDLQPEISVNLQSEVDPDPQPEITVDLKLDVDPDPQQETDPDPQPRIAVDLDSDADPNPQPEVDANHDFEVNPDSDPDPLPEVHTDDDTEEEEAF